MKEKGSSWRTARRRSGNRGSRRAAVSSRAGSGAGGARRAKAGRGRGEAVRQGGVAASTATMTGGSPGAMGRGVGGTPSVAVRCSLTIRRSARWVRGLVGAAARRAAAAGAQLLPRHWRWKEVG